ncbi:MAG: hypothetical protein IJ512_07680 [Ruminococcus sp.]|nr:hypothetical protein [Ruminococcus sp.]
MTEPSHPGTPVSREEVKIPPIPAQERRNTQTQAQPKIQMKRTSENGRLIASGKRFFGQFLIDSWVLRINGEKKPVPFGSSRLSMELPAGIYTVTAYTPYLGMHCMRATGEIEIRPGRTTKIVYETVFDVFKEGKLRKESSSQ